LGYLNTEITDGCRPFDIKSDVKTDIPFAILLSSDGCNPQIKALNAYHVGASLLIISLNKDEDIDEYMNHIYDMSFNDTPLSTIIIDSDTRTKLDNVIDNFIEPVIKLKVPIPDSNKAKVEFHILTNDLFFYKFVSSLSQVMNYFKKKTQVDVFLHKLEEDTNSNDDIAKMEVMINCLNAESGYLIIGKFAEQCVLKLEINSSCLQQTINTLIRKEFLQWQNCYLKKADKERLFYRS